jgi:hypothetical protein
MIPLHTCMDTAIFNDMIETPPDDSRQQRHPVKVTLVLGSGAEVVVGAWWGTIPRQVVIGVTHQVVLIGVVAGGALGGQLHALGEGVLLGGRVQRVSEAVGDVKHPLPDPQDLSNLVG